MTEFEQWCNEHLKNIKFSDLKGVCWDGMMHINGSPSILSYSATICGVKCIKQTVTPRGGTGETTFHLADEPGVTCRTQRALLKRIDFLKTPKLKVK